MDVKVGDRVRLWKVTDHNTCEEKLMCDRQCAEDYMVVHELEEDDLHELDPENEDDRVFIDECTPSSCDQCQRKIEKA